MQKEGELQFSQEPSSDNFKEWKEKALHASIEQAVVDFRQELCQRMKIQKKLKEMATSFFDKQNPTSQQIEQACDQMSQTLRENFEKKSFAKIEEKHPELCCPLTKKILKDPVIAEDGLTYERQAIEKHFATSDSSPKTGEKIKKRLTPNVTVKNLIDKLKDKLKNKSKKRKASFNHAIPPAKRQVVDAVAHVASSPLSLASSKSCASSSNSFQQSLVSQLESNSSQIQIENKTSVLNKISSSDIQKSLLNLIQFHPNKAKSYVALATTLPAEGSIKLRNGTTMTQQELFLKAIQLDANCALAYHNLAITLPAKGSIKLLNGTTMTKKDLLGKGKKNP